ncbi:hypothetical protein NPIL_164621, partial [Nephila pilipes]
PLVIANSSKAKKRINCYPKGRLLITIQREGGEPSLQVNDHLDIKRHASFGLYEEGVSMTGKNFRFPLTTPMKISSAGKDNGQTSEVQLSLRINIRSKQFNNQPHRAALITSKSSYPVFNPPSSHFGRENQNQIQKQDLSKVGTGT